MMTEGESKDEEVDKYTPEWAERAKYIDHKPEWVDAVPHELWDLGEVFFPIPRGKKGYNYPHHVEEKRFSPDDEIFNAYMDAGAGYGICCANDLVVVDVDEKEYIEFITNILPETMWQLTGSREGYHLFYKCPDLNTRITMKVNVPDNHCYAEGIGGEFPSFSRHIGEVKCDPHGYVVGPGSVHPSGNKYGPLKGEEISEVSKEDIKDALEPLEVGSGVNPSPSRYIDPEDYEVDDETDTHEFYELSADDVLPWLEPEKRIAHPIHGSTTGSNFMKNPDGHTFTCWRCQYGTGDGCGLSGAQFLAVRETGSDCEDVRRRWHDNPELHYHSWNRAVEDDIIDHEDPPFRVLLGYANHIGYADDPEEISGEAYWTLRKALEYEQTCM